MNQAMDNNLQGRLFRFSVNIIKEIRESNYWIRIIIEISEANTNWITFETKSKELMKILGSIYSKSSKHR